ncbi:MAG: transposase family protein [Desulfobacteraceae bacterium]|nr:transposase family protein [Desulfobacteraceae bacterium]
MSRYPRSKNIIYDNGSEFKLHFKSLCDSYGLKRKPTSIKNPQANAVLERIHAGIASMMRTSGLDNCDAITPKMIFNFLVNVG